ncbi:MAG TPA: MerR family transcriptional regulator [Armatimonadota bacterium]|nr:MerR family transcriptional regulator [Armatimonadota bacterium]
MRPPPWKVGELARRTGLTVRALHHYEEIGLLTPSERTEAGHRLYAEEDIVRLQQIMSLRQLGFPLEEVRECLRRPAFSPRRVIELHLCRLREQVALQQRLCGRLEAIATALHSAETVSIEELIRTIEEIKRVESYYTPEQLKELETRRLELGEEGMRKAEADWEELIAQVRAEKDAGTDPADERVRALARRWIALVRGFTGGNPEIASSLGKMWENETTIHGMETAAMRELMEYVGRALAAEQGS